MADEPTIDEPTTADANEATVQRDDRASTATADEPSSSATSQAAKTAEFTPLKPTPTKPGVGGPIDRFYDVHVPVWAELGRVEVPLGELVKLDEGSVLMLDRPVSEPVDLVSQGVKLARGEVIVIDDCFAIRIKEIISNKS
jgi:flagellar motor switch protein FliN